MYIIRKKAVVRKRGGGFFFFFNQRTEIIQSIWEYQSSPSASSVGIFPHSKSEQLSTGNNGSPKIS